MATPSADEWAGERDGGGKLNDRLNRWVADASIKRGLENPTGRRANAVRVRASVRASISAKE